MPVRNTPRDAEVPASPDRTPDSTGAPATSVDAGSLGDAGACWRLVEHARDVVMALDVGGRIIGVNRAGEALFGRRRTDLIGLPLASLAAPESRVLVASMLDRARRGGEPRVDELDVTSGDGRRVPLEVSSWAASGAGDGVVHAIARDITHRRRVEEALRQSEERFALLVEHSADGLALVTRDGRIVFASRPAMRVLGCGLEAVVGRQFVDLVHPDDRDRVAWLLASLVSQPGVAATAEYRCQHADGAWRVHEATFASHLDDPRVGALVVTFRDITARRRVEHALQQSEQRFQAVFDSALVGIIQIDLSGRVIEVNRATAQMGGYTPEELEGRPFEAFLHPDDRAASRADFEDLVAGRRSSYRAERRYLTKSGETVWANVTVSLVPGAAGEPRSCLALLENITERKHAEAELRATNARLSVWVQQLEQRTHEIGLLSEMGDLLRACRTPDEAGSVVARVAAQLFPGSAGVVALVAGAGSLVDPTATWGTDAVVEPFGAEDCWALRRGRPHVFESAQGGPACRHLAPLAVGATVCVPMMAHGELIGLFSVTAPDTSALPDARRRLAMTVAEHTALALANLKLTETLRSQSIRDPLTGLFNRRYMEESLEREMRRAVRSRQPVGIIMIDLDHFKAFNDAYGHDAGDAMLRLVGQMLQRGVRAEDIACRYGGEEFTLILPEASLLEAAQRAEYLRQAVKQLPVVHRKQTLTPVTFSAGVAVYPDHGPTADAVLRAADMALYHAKARGRDRVSINRAGGLFADGIEDFSQTA